MSSVTSWRNWAGLSTSRPSEVLTPAGTEKIIAAIAHARESGGTVKMPGTGHSFTSIAAPEGVMLDPSRLRGITEVDRDAMTVTARSGTQLKALNAGLEGLGLSLHNMGDIAEQTIAGATSTGTHGTGGVVASISAQIAAMELVTGTGEVVRTSATVEPDLFAVARVGLGALGIITSLTFEVEPVFTLEAHEHPMPWDEVLGDFDRLATDNHHFEFYWFPHTERCLVKENNRVLDDAAPLSGFRRWLDDDFLSNTVFGLTNRIGNARPGWIPGINNIAGQLLSARTFSDVPHKVFVTDRRVVFREMEYAVPREAGVQALRDVRAWLDSTGKLIRRSVEVRVAPADDIALSTASARDSVYLAFHVNKATDHTEYFAGVEDILRGYDGRPHWGKLHSRTAADLAPAYPRFEEFLAIRDRLDPDRVFANHYLRQVLGD